MPGDAGWQPYQGLVHKQQLALAIRAAAVGKRGIASPSPVPANFRCENNANGGLSD
jgi:hypothetical protein